MDANVDGVTKDKSVASAIDSLVTCGSHGINGLFLVLLEIYGEDGFAEPFSQALGHSISDISATLRNIRIRSRGSDICLTGAEATALILHQTGVSDIFTYPGTSELALCECLLQTPGITLVNGRGDKECVFLAAGANLLGPHGAVAILHGARGLTNAMGAILDANRNEIPTPIVVGLPSTASEEFLPPHGEPGLLEVVGKLVKWWAHFKRVPRGNNGQHTLAKTFASLLFTCIHESQELPYGATIFGLPQDAAEERWLPWNALKSILHSSGSRNLPSDLILNASQIIAASKRVAVLIDDYFLKYEKAKTTLKRFANIVGAPIFQIRYQRGPMLFQSLCQMEIPQFRGWFDSESQAQRLALENADLLVTLEDRNMYHRVIGCLPSCRKIAINSNGEKVRKNKYLSTNDVLIEGDAVALLEKLCEGIDSIKRENESSNTTCWLSPDVLSTAQKENSDYDSTKKIRSGIVEILAHVMATAKKSLLVDDSQMFGGLIADDYSKLPSGTKIFGDHGGFVGSGIGYATGLAIAEKSAHVFCLLGDQGFMNGCQGLISAYQEQVNVIFIVCNNGGAVSLIKQMLANGISSSLVEPRTYLSNTDELKYTRIGEAFGVATWVIDFGQLTDLAQIEKTLLIFKEVLVAAMHAAGPALIEIRLPKSLEFWSGIWRVRGFDEPETSQPI